jgi:small subunit ribosomal protein S9
LPEAQFVGAATGKRKTAIARVRLRPGTGQMLVNGRPVSEYFPREAHQIMVREPLEATDAVTRFDIQATITGGGPAGQAGALRHGLARAIQIVDPGQRAALKTRGHLTRDSRKKERKKYGQRGARARFQFSKR